MQADWLEQDVHLLERLAQSLRCVGSNLEMLGEHFAQRPVNLKLKRWLHRGLEISEPLVYAPGGLPLVNFTVSSLATGWIRALLRLCASRCVANEVTKSTEKGRLKGLWAVHSVHNAVSMSGVGAAGHLECPYQRGGLHDCSRPQLVDES